MKHQIKLRLTNKAPLEIDIILNGQRMSVVSHPSRDFVIEFSPQDQNHLSFSFIDTSIKVESFYYNHLPATHLLTSDNLSNGKFEISFDQKFGSEIISSLLRQSHIDIVDQA